MVIADGTRMDPAREQDLVARARADGAAFGELYDFYLPRIYAFIARRIGDRATAEDLTAAAFERALGAVRRDGFRNDSFGGFLYRIAANAVVDHARRSRRLLPFGRRAADHDREGDAEAALEMSDDAAARAFSAALDRDVVARALAQVADHHRRVIVLRYLDGLGPEELGAALGCSRATAAVRLHRALRAVRGLLTEEASDVA
jgi:RNA polymerase sigma-70 factor (ECF subfamily)